MNQLDLIIGELVRIHQFHSLNKSSFLTKWDIEMNSNE